MKQMQRKFIGFILLCLGSCIIGSLIADIIQIHIFMENAKTIISGGFLLSIKLVIAYNLLSTGYRWFRSKLNFEESVIKSM